MYNSNLDIPLYIGDKEIFTKNKQNITPPHDHKHLIGCYSVAEEKHIEDAIDCALKAKKKME